MSDNKMSKEELKKLEDEAYFELCQIIAEAMQLQDIELLENFKIESVEELDTRDIKVLDEREKYWIKQYNSTNPEVGYNVDEGGHVISTKCRETKRLMQIGVPLPESTKQKLREANNKIAKSVCQYSINGELLGEYPSIIEASRQTGTDRRTIQRQLKGESNIGTSHSRGNLKYIWKYKDV